MDSLRDDIPRLGHTRYLIALTSTKEPCLCDFSFSSLPSLPVPILKIPMALHQREKITADPSLLQVCRQGLNHQRIF